MAIKLSKNYIDIFVADSDVYRGNKLIDSSPKCTGSYYICSNNTTDYYDVLAFFHTRSLINFNFIATLPHEELNNYIESVRTKIMPVRSSFLNELEHFVTRQYTNDFVVSCTINHTKEEKDPRYFLYISKNIRNDENKNLFYDMILPITIIELYKQGDAYFFRFKLIDNPLEQIENKKLEIATRNLKTLEKMNNTYFEIEQKIINSKTIAKTQKEQIIKARIGQGYFREQLVKEFNGTCPITNIKCLDLLIASHIKPWSDRTTTNEERVNHNNGLLLSALYDKLFDKGYITFDDEGRIMFSQQLDNHTRRILRQTDEKFDLKLNDERKKYLSYHRQHVFKK